MFVPKKLCHFLVIFIHHQKAPPHGYWPACLACNLASGASDLSQATFCCRERWVTTISTVSLIILYLQKIDQKWLESTTELRFTERATRHILTWYVHYYVHDVFDYVIIVWIMSTRATLVEGTKRLIY
jgi:transposase InsO family protein